MTNRILLFIFTIFISLTLAAQDGNVIEVTGQVRAQDKKEPLSDVSVLVKGNTTGVVTDKTGNFLLRTRTKLPFTLIFSSIGFSQQEVEVKSLGSNVNVELATQTVLGHEVVVTASRMPESILKSPVAIDKLDIRAIRETP